MTHPAPRRIRILRLITRLNVGGPARHVVWLTEGLNDAAFETVLVTGTVPRGEDDMTAFAETHNVKPVVFSEMSREISPADVRTIWKVFWLLRSFRPHVVHTHTAKAGTVGRVAGLLYCYLTPGTLIGRPNRCKFIHTFHGHVFHGYYGRLKSLVFVTIERILARLCTDRIVVLSAQQLHEIHHVFRVGRPEQFVVVPLGIDLEAVRRDVTVRPDLRKQLGTSADQTLVGIIGRLTAIKNHELFLRIARHFDESVRFAIFGDGAMRAALEKKSQQLNVSDRVIFAGVCSPAEVYSAVDVVALTSLNEGTPLALIEAMANGLPVVSTAVGGVVDLLGQIEQSVTEPGVAYHVRERGITVASGDEDSFAAGLKRMIQDEDLRRRLAQRGQTYVAENYSKDRLVADIMRLTRDLTS